MPKNDDKPFRDPAELGLAEDSAFLARFENRLALEPRRLPDPMAAPTRGVALGVAVGVALAGALVLAWAQPWLAAANALALAQLGQTGVSPDWVLVAAGALAAAALSAPSLLRDAI